MKNKIIIVALSVVLLLLTGCPNDDKTYTTAEEQYLIGWILHNVDDATETNLDYSENDFAVYNYSFNFPAQQPEYFANVLFWVPPIHKFGGGDAAASHIRLGVPLNRLYYLKGVNPVPENYVTDWSFSNSIYLNHLKSDNGLGQFALDVSQAEHYQSEDAFRAIKPVPGEKKNIFFGTAPFTPASLVIKDNTVTLNGHLIRGYNNNSYLTRVNKTGAFSPTTGEEIEINFPEPEYNIYLNGILKEEGKLVKNLGEGFGIFDYSALDYTIVEDGNYLTNISIPSNYPVWNYTIITASFTSPSAEMQPPEFQHMEMSPHFEANKETVIEVDLHDESGIKETNIYTREINEWVKLATEIIDKENSIYRATYTPSAAANKIDLKIEATDAIGNSVNYTILPAALPAKKAAFNFDSKDKIAGRGSTINLEGLCKIDNEACNNFLIKGYINNEFFEASQTSDDGSFDLNFIVPSNYNGDEINITAKYAGTGIYLPHEETTSIPTEFFDIDIGIFDIEISEFKPDVLVIVSGIVKNLGSQDVSDVIVKFSVDGKKFDEAEISELKLGAEQKVEFEWPPKRESYYDIELEAEADNDQNKENNKLEKFTKINFIAPDISASILFESVKNPIIGTETEVEFELFNNGEEKAENIKAYLYDFYKPESAFFNFFPESPAEEEPKETPVEETPGEAESAGKEEGAEEEPAEPEPGQPGGGGGGGTTKPDKPTKSPDKREIIYNGVKYNLSAENHGDYIIFNASTDEFKDSLNFTDSDRIEQLQNNVYVYMSFFSDSYADFFLGDASEAAKDIDDLNPLESTEDKIKWKPENAGDYRLVLFANTTKDSNFDSNHYDTNVKVLRTGINIKAELDIDYSSEYIIGQESEITAKLTNHGTADAENIKITLFEQQFNVIEEEGIFKPKTKLIAGENIKTLKQKETKTVKFKWKPSKPGENSLLLIAETKGDINPEDNDYSSFIDVISESADITSYFDWTTMSKLYSESIFANEEQQLIAIVRNKGKSDANDASLSLYEIIDSETRLVEKKDIGVLKAEAESKVEFNWIPSKNGIVEVEIEGIAPNDNNQENNNDSIIVDVLVKDVDVKVTLESYPKFILADENNPIGILLQNFGSEDAPGFALDLKVNDVKADSTGLEGLGSGSAEFVSLDLVPKNDGEFKIKAEINLADADLSNNNDTDTVKVFKTKDIKLGFVDKDGNNVERALVLGNYEMFVDEPIVLAVPDTKLKMWIGDEKEGNIAASIYSNTIIGNDSITSAHIKELTAQDGLALYEIFANNDSWSYEAFSSFLARSIDTLNIRYTELEGFYCNDYNFSDNRCKEWKDIPLETLVSRGDLLVSMDTAKATAIALGDKDYDNDNAPDWDDKDSDNDGINDEDDTFTCFNGRLGSREMLDVTVNENKDTKKEFKGKNKVGIKDENKKIVEFNVDLDKDKLDCREIIVEKQPEITTRGFTLIKGVSLTDENKTAYVDKIAGFNRVCIKDKEVESIDELSQNCDGSSEFLVMCDGIKHGNYTCTNVGSQYKVEGLRHSAVAEPTSCQESWSCTGWSDCKDRKQTRTCTDTNACGTNFNKPSEQRSCGDKEEEEDEDEERSGSLSRNTFDLGEIKGWSDGKSRTLKLGERDLVIFTFDKKLRSIELEQIKGTKISIKPSWSGKSIDLTAGETETFDIDNDKKDDIKFTFEEISRDKAMVVIERTIEDARVTETTRAQPQPADAKDDLRKELEKAETPSVATEAEDSGIRGAIMLVVFFAILSVIIGAIIYKREEIMEFISEKTGSKESKPLSEYDKLKSYILNELNRGFTMEQVRGKLEEVGWQKELIELVMRDIKKDR